MRVKLVFLVLCLSMSATAQEAVVDIDLGVTDPATPRFFSVPAGKKFTLRLFNALPNKSYLIVEEGREKTTTVELPATPDPKCDKPKDKLAAITKDKTLESDVAKAFAAEKFEGCSEAQIKAVKDLVTLTFDGYTALAAGETRRRTIKRDAVEWKIVLTPQGTTAAPTANAGADVLDRLREVTDKHPSLIVMKCSYSAEKCASDALYVNSDQVSTIYITDVPKGKPLTVRVGAGEYFPCEAATYNFETYTSSPDTIIVPVHLTRGVGSMFGTQRAQRQAEQKYGLTGCPNPDQPSPSAAKTSAELTTRMRNVTAAANDPRWLEGQARIQAMTTDISPEIITKDPADPTKEERVEVPIPPADPQIPLFVRGRSEVAAVQFDFGGGDVKTIIIPLRYQRFWLDAGGFFVFARHTDQQLDLETLAAKPANGDIPATAERKLVRAIRSETLIEPTTGIVINVHPGNYPFFAVQFGIAANASRSPSYYLGLGLRAREIGKRGLATIAVGAAMQQETQFPLLHVGDNYPSGDAILQPKLRYGITLPYISISLGFSFGGVSEKTDVKSSVSKSN